jgi:hypothetical protein
MRNLVIEYFQIMMNAADNFFNYFKNYYPLRQDHFLSSCISIVNCISPDLMKHEFTDE